MLDSLTRQIMLLQGINRRWGGNPGQSTNPEKCGTALKNFKFPIHETVGGDYRSTDGRRSQKKSGKMLDTAKIN